MDVAKARESIAIHLVDVAVIQRAQSFEVAGLGGFDDLALRLPIGRVVRLRRKYSRHAATRVLKERQPVPRTAASANDANRSRLRCRPPYIRTKDMVERLMAGIDDF